MLSLLGETHDDVSFDLWNAVRAMAADLFGVSWYRGASSLPIEIIALVLKENDLMEFDFAASVDVEETLKQLQTVPPEEWSVGYHMMHEEVQAVLLEQSSEEAPVSTGCVSELPAADDTGLRSACLQAMADRAASYYPDEVPAERSAPASGGAEVMSDTLTEQDESDPPGQCFEFR